MSWRACVIYIKLSDLIINNLDLRSYGQLLFLFIWMNPKTNNKSSDREGKARK